MQTSHGITRKSASNLALAFALLPAEKRNAMSALYAFCREVDDIADEDSVSSSRRAERLAAWRTDIRRACEGQQPEFAVNREFQPFIQKYRLPFSLFDELINGCEMDLRSNRYTSFQELEQYCFRVASVVGLLSIEIFSYTNSNCRSYAIELGHALQLTNILRDVQADAQRNRIYIPQEVLQAHSVKESEILRGQYTDRFARVAQTVADQARMHYSKARRSLPQEDRRSMVAAELMGSVYWKLLMKIESNGYQVLQARSIRLSKFHKMRMVLQAWWQHATRASCSTYGTA